MRRKDKKRIRRYVDLVLGVVVEIDKSVFIFLFFRILIFFVLDRV